MSRSFLVGLSLAAGLLFVTPVSAAEGDDLVLDLGDVNMELKRVPHGTFTMGSLASEFGHQPDEEPQRLVTITRDYWVGKMPVTKGEFAKFVADSKYVTEAEKGQAGGSGWDGKGLVQKKEFNWRNPGFTQTDDHPVVMVTFSDASAFAQWASRKTGKRVRLPTEAEWEFAVRGGTTTPWFAAKTEDEALALGWYKPNSAAGTHPVGQRKANPFGLFDMGGDVFEWCRDIYGPYTKDPVTDPENQVHVGTEPERRVLRGGSWLRLPQRGRSAARYRNAPGARNADNGFRVVVSNDDTLGAGFVSPVDSAADAGANATQAPPAPTPSIDAPAPETSGGGWLLFAAPTGAAAAVLGWIFGRRRTSGSTGDGTSARAIEDGFFVRVTARKGDRVHYACVVGDESLRGDVPYDGAAETFVYTGGRPEAIRIRVVEGEGVRVPPPRPVVTPAAPPVIAPIPKPIAPPIEEIEPLDEEEIEPEPVAVRVSVPPPVPRPVSEPPPPRSLSKPPPSRVEEKVPSVIIAAGVEVESAPEPSSPVLQETTEPLVPPGPRSGPISGPVSGPPAPSPTTLASMAAASPAPPPPEPEVSAPEIEPEIEPEPMSEPIIPAPVISVRDLPIPPIEPSTESEAEPLALLPKSSPDMTEERVGPPSKAPLVAEHASALAALDALDEKETAQDLSKMRPITETIKPKALVELLKGNEEVEDFVGPPTPVPSPLLVAPAPSAPEPEESSDESSEDLEETEQPPAVAAIETTNEPKMSAKARKRARAAARKAARKKSQSKPDLEDDDKE